MNLVEQIFAQAQMGTGRDPGNPFAQGLQLGMEQQRIDVAKRQLAQQFAQEQVMNTFRQQEADMTAFKLDELRKQRDLELSNEQDVQNLANIIAQSQASANPEDSEAYIWEAISRNGKLMDDSRVKTMFNEVKSSLAAKMQLQALKNANEKPVPAEIQRAREYSSLKTQLADSESRVALSEGMAATTAAVNAIPGAFPVPNVFEGAVDPAAERRKQAELQAQLDVLKPKESTDALGEKLQLVRQANAKVENAAKSGDPAAIAAATSERDQVEALSYPKGTKLRAPNPQTGKMEDRIVGGTTEEQDQLTAATRSKLQQQIDGTVQAAKTLHDMEQNVDWTSVGPVAWANEKVGRYTPLGLIGFGKPGAAARAQIRGGKLDIMRELELRGHTSPTVMKAISETMPSLGIFENPQAAKLAIADRKRTFIVDGLTASKQLGVKPPVELIQLLSTYPTKEITRMVNTGLITAEDGRAAAKLQFQKLDPKRTPTPAWVK